jgi:hypothetical protein
MGVGLDLRAWLGNALNRLSAFGSGSPSSDTVWQATCFGPNGVETIWLKVSVSSSTYSPKAEGSPSLVVKELM